MARFELRDYISLGTIARVTAASWQIAKDPEFTIILDFIDKSSLHRTEWNSPVPRENGIPGYYRDLDLLHARVKLWSGDSCSDWYILPPKNQNDQVYNLTYKGNIIRQVHSLTENIHLKGIHRA